MSSSSLFCLLQVTFDCLVDDQMNHSFAHTKIGCTDAFVEASQAILLVDSAHTFTAGQFAFSPMDMQSKYFFISVLVGIRKVMLE